MTDTEMPELEPKDSAHAASLSETIKRRLERSPASISAILRKHWKKIFPMLGFAAIASMTAQVVGFHAGVLPLSGIIALTLAVSGALWFIPRKNFASLFANTFGWLPVTIGALSYFFWYQYAVNLDSPDADFFHASADVLPVLLLAAVIDVRRSRTLESKGLILPIIAVFLGEVAALNALAWGFTGPGDFAAVSSSLVSTTVALVLAVLADFSSPLNDSVQDEDEDEDEEERDESTSGDAENYPQETAELRSQEESQVNS